ncbi:MAG: flavin reductase [Bacteroidales bacterium]|nr:flavin reductase [Bacteroidales bacterium]
METLKDYADLDPYKIGENIFNLLDNKWMLITSGTKEHFNMMTASWGGMGVLWNKAVVTLFIRPQRYTYKFVEENSSFNVCFFNQEYKPALNFCGTKSGRDFDKVKETGLTPVLSPNNSITFKEAYLSIDCIKLYSDDLKSSNFIDKSLIDRIYPSKDFHRFYIGEIIGCYLL